MPEPIIIRKLQFFPGVAELADAADSKSAGDHSPCGFDSLLRDVHFSIKLRLAALPDAV